jgi:subtilisin family serine protease
MRYFAAAVIALAAFAWNGEVQGQGLPNRKQFAEGEILVKYRPGIHQSAIATHEKALALSVIKSIRGDGIYHMKSPTGLSTEEAVSRLRQDSLVEYAEPNYYRFLKGVPNDTQFGTLWGLTQIAAPAAWDVSSSCGSVIVALVDTGVDYTHPDLAANIWANAGESLNGLDDDANGKIDDIRGWDFVHQNNDPMDANGHGTAVAGIIGAVGNNSRGVAGVCWNPKIMPLRAIDASGFATVADIVQAMSYAQANGASIINASFGGSTFSQTEYDAIAQLHTRNILLVAVSGNEAVDNDATPTYPANYDLPNILAVAATDAGDNLSTYSNYGVNTVDVGAPGDDITSTALQETVVLANQGFESGTAGWSLAPPWGLGTISLDGSLSLSDSPSGNYPAGENVSAVAPVMNLTGTNGGFIEFFIGGRIVNDGDALFVETAPASGGPWTARSFWLTDGENVDFVDSITGSLPTWNQATVYFDDTETSATFYARFRMQTNSGGTDDGIYIDDMSASAFTRGSDAYGPGTGTSFSAPYATGLAALIVGSNPGITGEEVKGRILDCVDRVPALTDRLLSGGRINARNCLLNLPAYPIGLTATLASTTAADIDWTANYSGAITLRIERGESDTGPFTEIAAVAATSGPYLDGSLQAGRTYFYRAKAQSAGGTSAYSAAVQAVPASQGSGGGGGGGCFIGALF